MTGPHSLLDKPSPATEKAVIATVAVARDDCDGLTDLGLFLLRRGDLVGAPPPLALAIEASEQNGGTDVLRRRQFAGAQAAAGMTDEAMETLGPAAGDGAAAVDLAVLVLGSGRTDEARVMLQAAIPVDPTGRARLHLAYCHLVDGDAASVRLHLMAIASSGAASDSVRAKADELFRAIS